MKTFIKIFVASIILVVFGISCTGLIIDYRFKNLDLKTEILRSFPSKVISFKNAKSVDYKLIPYPQIVAKEVSSTKDLGDISFTIAEAKFTPNILDLIFENKFQTEKLELENVIFKNNNDETKKANIKSLLGDMLSIKMMPKLKEVTFKDVFLDLKFNSLKIDDVKIINEVAFNFNTKKIFVNSTSDLSKILYDNEILDIGMPNDMYYTTEIDFLNLETVELSKLFLYIKSNSNNIEDIKKNLLESLRDEVLISTTISTKGFSNKNNEKLYEDESKVVFSKYKEGFKLDGYSNLLKILDKKNLITSKFDAILNVISESLDANFNVRINDSKFNGSLKMNHLGPKGPEYILFKVDNKNINLTELAKLIKQSFEKAQIPIPFDIDPSGIIKEIDVYFEINTNENINNYKVTLNAENILVTPFGINKVYTNFQDAILHITKNKKGLDKTEITYRLNASLYDSLELLSDDNSNIGSNIDLKANFDSKSMKEQFTVKIENSILKINFDKNNKNGNLEFTCIPNDKDSEFYKTFGEMPIVFNVNGHGIVKIINVSNIVDKILAK